MNKFTVRSFRFQNYDLMLSFKSFNNCIFFQDYYIRSPKTVKLYTFKYTMTVKLRNFFMLFYIDF